MWSFWSRNPIKDFPYEIGDAIQMPYEESFWVLHKGKRKSTGEDVSIFQFECKPGTEHLLDNARSALKRLKTLRHPSILTYLDSMESDKMICFVTEPVTTLREYLRKADNFTKEQRNNAISYGLYQVAVGIGFINNDCSCTHNNIHMGSILVNNSGIWRIGGLEYMTNFNPDDPARKLAKHSTSLAKYDPPEVTDPSRQKNSQKWSFDSYGLGCLIWEVFNGPLSDASNLKSTSKIPANLIAFYKELLHPNPKTRLSSSDFVKKCHTKGAYMKNSFIDAMLFLEEIQIKDSNERNRFFSHLNDNLDSFPPDICREKVVNQLATALEFNSSVSAILGPLLKIGRLLNENDYQKKIIPCVIKLFSSKDRATRGRLLHEMDSYIDHIQPNIVNDQVFLHVAQGFLDSNNIIREQTVKCMLHLAPKLNYSNLNEEVLKHFGRLQTRDEESGIRTNTAVCLGKIAKYLHPQIRQTVLIPFFLRSMRDPFPPARVAGILALSATQNFYSLRDTATKVMPALCHLTMDPDKSVRDQAFKALKGFVSKLEKVSEDASLAEQMEADLNASGSNVTTTFAASWASWAVSSLTSKFYRTKPMSSSNTINEEPSGTVNVLVAGGSKTSGKQSSTPSEDSHHDYEEVWASLEDKTSNTDEKTGKSLDGWEDDSDWVPELESESKDLRPSFTKKETGKKSPKALVNEADTLFEEFESLIQPRDMQISPVQNYTDDFLEEKEPIRPRKPPDSVKERKVRQSNKGPMKLGARKIS